MTIACLFVYSICNKAENKRCNHYTSENYCQEIPQRGTVRTRHLSLVYQLFCHCEIQQAFRSQPVSTDARYMSYTHTRGQLFERDLIDSCNNEQLKGVS